MLLSYHSLCLSPSKSAIIASTIRWWSFKSIARKAAVISIVQTCLSPLTIPFGTKGLGFSLACSGWWRVEFVSRPFSANKPASSVSCNLVSGLLSKFRKAEGSAKPGRERELELHSPALRKEHLFDRLIEAEAKGPF
jgi:hypothetical protein